jgi:hypothetical protein
MFLLLQQQPLETTNFMIAGFVVIFGSIGLYLASLYVRWRNLQQDLEVLQELEETGSSSTSSEVQVFK